MANKLSEAEINYISVAHVAGDSIAQIADCLGRSFTVVYLYLNESSRSRYTETAKGWRKKHQKQLRDHMRFHVGTTKDGRQICGINRRERPEGCELCGNVPPHRLHYHHWDDDDLDTGLWLCTRCHRFAESTDAGMMEHLDEYLQLKNMATEETHVRTAIMLRDRATRMLEDSSNGNHSRPVLVQVCVDTAKARTTSQKEVTR